MDIHWKREPRDHAARKFFVSRLFSWIETRPFRALALILLFAFLLDAPRLWFMPISVQSGETASWWPIVENVEDGDGYTDCITAYFPFCKSTNQVTAEREPAPVFLFAAVSLLTRDTLTAAAFVEIVLNLVIVAGVFALARAVAGIRIALFAALLWTLYLPPVKSAIAEVSGDLLATCCLTWGIFLFLRANRSNRSWEWIVAGLCLGVAALSRSALLAVPCILALGIVCRPDAAHDTERPSLRSRLRPAALLLLACGLALSPWLARNYVVFGRPVLGTTLTGYNLYRENATLPTDNYTHFVGGPEADRAIASLIARRTDLTGKENEAQMDAVYRGAALHLIAAEPLRYAIASLARFPMLWFDWTVPQAYGNRYTGLDYLVMCQQGLLLLAAIAGTWCLRWRAWPLVSGVVVVTLLYMAVIGRLYLLVPVMPLVIVLSTVGCAWIGQKGWRATIDTNSGMAAASYRRHDIPFVP